MHDVRPASGATVTSLCFAPAMPYFTHCSTETLLLLAGEWRLPHTAAAEKLCYCLQRVPPASEQRYDFTSRERAPILLPPPLLSPLRDPCLRPHRPHLPFPSPFPSTPCRRPPQGARVQR